MNETIRAHLFVYIKEIAQSTTNHSNNFNLYVASIMLSFNAIIEKLFQRNY